MDDNTTIEKLKKRIQELEAAEAENQRLAAALETVEETYRLITENSAEVIAILGMDLGIIHVSPAVMGLRGFTPEEVGKQTLEQVLTPESMRLAVNVMAEELELEAAGAAEPYRTRILELEQYKKDGSTVWVETSLSFLRSKDGKPAGILSLSRDISKRKQAEKALQMFRELVDNSSNVIGISTPEGKHFYQNEAFDNLFGAIGDDPSSVYVDKSVAAKMFAAIQAGRRWDGEVKMIARDGSVRDILLRAYANKDIHGRVTELVGIHTDITERKQAEEARVEALARFYGFSEASQYGMGMADLDGHIVYVNSTLARMLGEASPEACLGKHFPTTYYSRAMAGKLQKEVLSALMRDGHWQGELELIALDGRRIPTEENYFVIRDEQGKPAYLADILTDITERRQAEAKRAELEGQLHQAQKLESVGRLAGGVAHDFNNMLSVIIGFTELAMTKVDPSQPLFADLAEIRKAAGRSGDLTRQLLAFARKQTIAPKILDLNDTVAGMINMLRRLIGEDIHLIWKPGADLWAVHMDPTQIDQILANLCVNARDAISDVGAITIETENVGLNEAFCLGKEGCFAGEYVCLAVIDTGKGMDRETLDQIFEPFFTTKTLGKGTGLGLATVYGIVKQNNGFIDVKSEPGRGTAFHIYLPRHTVKAGRAEKEGPAESDANGHETILLVEDEPAILEMTTQMLKLHGYQVLAANTPGRAIQLAREHAGEIHLLMTDIVMPEMNGRDLAKNLLSLYPDIRRLFMSGYTADVIAHHGVLEDGVHFIQKPFTIRNLRAKVREALEG